MKKWCFRPVDGTQSGLFFLLIGVVSISFAAPFFKLAAPTHPLVSAATRLSIASVIWWFFISVQRGVARERVEKMRKGKLVKYACLCGICYAVHFGAWVWSLGLTSVLTSATLVTTTPIMLGVIGLMSGKDQPNLRLIFSGLVAMAGVALFTLEGQAGGAGSLQGDGLALLGAFAMVPYLLLSRALGEDMVISVFSAITTSVGALCLWSVTWIALPCQDLGVPTQKAFLALLGAALIPQMIGHSALTLSLKSRTPTEVGMATVAEPIGASVLAWILLTETPSLVGVLASVLTLSAVLFALTSEQN